MTRAFVAIRLAPPVLDALQARVSPVPMPGGRTTPRDQRHITVQFLGDDADISACGSALAHEPLDLVVGRLQLGGAVALGDARRARILALGLRVGADWVRELAGRVEARLAPLGFVRDREDEFVAHVTLARFRVPTDLRPLCAALGPEPVGPPFLVDEVVLFESVLRPQGAEHIARRVFRLGA